MYISKITDSRNWPTICYDKMYLDLPVMLSHKILDVIIAPEQANILSKSGCAICLGRPETYKLAPFIASLLGLAYDT